MLQFIIAITLLFRTVVCWFIILKVGYHDWDLYLVCLSG
jgi:hypothetical protein